MEDWFDVDNQHKKLIDLISNLDKKIDVIGQEVSEFDELRMDVTEIKQTQQEIFNKLEKMRMLMVANQTKILEKFLEITEENKANHNKLMHRLDFIDETQKDTIKDLKKENDLPGAIFPFLDTTSFVSERSKNMLIRKHTPFKFLPTTVDEHKKN